MKILKGTTLLLTTGLLLLLMLGVMPVAAQQAGEISGFVRDSTGGAIAGANVTITNLATQQTRATTTSEVGSYVLTYVPSGTYSVQAEKSGFKLTTQTGVSVSVGTVSRVDFALEVGSLTQTVEVTSAAPLINVDSVALGSVLQSAQIVNLPLNGRDYLSLVTLDTNAVGEMGAGGAGGLQGGARAGTAISISGQRLEYNHYTLDGAENTDPNFNSYIIHPSVDYVLEFKVQTGVYSAEFGRGASQINVNTVGGGNAFHGAAFEFLRNSALDAKQWNQQGKKNPFRRNQYGFMLSGPVLIPKILNGRDRLFFASNYEANRDRTTSQQTASIATAAMRAGDFSSATLKFPTIYDPATRVFFPGGGGTATPFPENKIPVNRFDSAVANLMQERYYPMPTTPGDVLTRNYIRQGSSINDATQFNQRIDFTESNSSSWFGRYSWGDDEADTTGTFYYNGSFTSTKVQQGVLSNTRMFGNATVNETRFAWNQFQNDTKGYFANKLDVQSTLGIKGLVSFGPLSYSMPAVSIGQGITGPSGGVTPWITRNNTFQFMDGLSFVRGRHSLKVGGEVRRIRYNQRGNQKEAGEFVFDGQSSSIPTNMTGTGYAFGDFLLGLPGQVYRIMNEANGMLRSTYYAAYIQDDWKLTNKLTFNLGLRYENTRPWVDKYDAMINIQIFDNGVTADGKSLKPNVQQPIFTRPGKGDFYEGFFFRFAQPQQVQRGNQYMGRGLVDPDNSDFGPRIGLAYNPAAGWSIRAGFGVYYVMDVGNVVFDMARNMGGKDGFIVGNTQRTIPLHDPWGHEVGSPKCPGYAGLCSEIPQFQGNVQGNRTGYVGQYLFNLQREVTNNLVLEAGYLGNQGHHLQRFMVMNQAVPKTGPTDNSSIAQRRPFPGYGPIQQVEASDNSNYHALNLKLTQRMTKGLSATVGYTFSKAMDFGSATRTNSGDTLWPWNSYDRRSLYGPSQFNMPRRFVASYVYELPFGKGKSFANTGIGNYLLGGWQLSGILTLGDGTNIQGSGLGDTASLGTLSNKPDATGVSPIPDTRDANHFWNPAAFDFSTPDLSWRVGTIGRNALSTAGSRTFNAALARRFRIKEGHALETRFEAFNATNHPNWNTPPNDPRTKSTFGIVTSAKTMRQLQLAMKYTF